MKRKLLAVSLALVLFSTVAPVGLAQTQDSKQATTDAQDWQGLDGLKPGTKILIEFKGGRREPTIAKLFAVRGRSLIVLQNDTQFSVPQGDIQRIYLKGKWSRDRTAKIGAGIGIVVGLAIGFSRTLEIENTVRPNPSVSDLNPAFSGFFLGALAGAGVGALLGKNRGKLLYEAR